MMLVITGADGTWIIGTRQRANSQRTVGAVGGGWNLVAINQYDNAIAGYRPLAQAISESVNTVTSIDTVNDFFTRDNVTNFTTNPVTTRPETIYNNAVDGVARLGYRWRKPETGVINSIGATVNVSEFIDLSIRGMGINATGLPGAGSFSLSVTRP